MKEIDKVEVKLRQQPRKWLVTGVAGFIGSNLLEELLKLGQEVIGLDNFSTGYRHNLEDVKKAVVSQQWSRFVFHEGDIRSLDDCKKVCAGVDYVLHQAALGSVPRSIDDPISAHQSNTDGFLNMMVAARDGGVKRFIFAASSATYGDDPGLPKVESRIGRSLSPYALTKLINELYADVFARIYGVESIGLRYFNVFGRRQDPDGAYAAVIPRWIQMFLDGRIPIIHGDGETSRDFCYVQNVVDANLLAATTENREALNQVYNVACGNRTTLAQLYQCIKEELSSYKPEVKEIDPAYGPLRMGDVRHSLADISKARDLLGYVPEFDVRSGMSKAITWYLQKAKDGC